MSKSSLSRRRQRRKSDPKVLARRAEFARAELEAKKTAQREHKAFMAKYLSGRVPRKRRERT